MSFSNFDATGSVVYKTLAPIYLRCYSKPPSDIIRGAFEFENTHFFLHLPYNTEEKGTHFHFLNVFSEVAFATISF